MDTIIASLQLVVVSPGMYFPHFFNADSFPCPKCDKCATLSSPFVRQGFTYQPRFVYGLNGIEAILFVDVYRHKECGATMKNERTGKYGSSSFSALHPKMTSQYSDVLRQWYPYLVSQRTIVSRAVKVFNGAARLAGMSLSAVASCLAETANSAKTLLENSQILAEIQVRQRGSSPETKKTMDDYVQRSISSSKGTGNGVKANNDKDNETGKSAIFLCLLFVNRGCTCT